ncbi:undecaprenyl-diphosphate phosphatase [Simiduia agarivorans]|uniref:Undecaprenyl-diphosphatase n=1 Tax=Simiduia agarivorans (strain DSM 21679 / JCM 13881 / BCRC 17597 / SA1) TaxID=1117647 RepID=K4KEX0_SIMAS|nr:undecaprenyl-diphosphate phosphatase [Simiduia agarivorans]AFU97491.1 undecaprenyl pyrophosphate phosphatase [Simiduia agarivorans SA1 = DSM 21679]
MDWLQTLILALIQGLTEFLPISSSAHLILPSELLGWQDQGLAFDVAVHFGSLLAVILYFRRDLTQLAGQWFASFGGKTNHESQLVWMIGFATIPAGLAGLLGKEFIETHLRSAEVIAWATIGFGLLLGLADRQGRGVKTLIDMTWPLALAIGIAQALALVPGTSRSGITMTAALLLGFSRTDAARFSFLLSIPVIALSAGYLSYKLIGVADVDWATMGLGFVLSALSAYACIHFFMQLIERIGMMPFVIYRLVLGVALLWLL